MAVLDFLSIFGAELRLSELFVARFGRSELLTSKPESFVTFCKVFGFALLFNDAPIRVRALNRGVFGDGFEDDDDGGGELERSRGRPLFPLLDVDVTCSSFRFLFDG